MDGEWLLIISLFLPAQDNNVIGTVHIPQHDQASCLDALDGISAVNEGDPMVIFSAGCSRRASVAVED